MKDYLLDIQKQVDSTDFGTLTFHVKRGRSKTTELSIVSTDTHVFDNNQQALESLLIILDGLLASGLNHDITFNISIKQGMIKLIGYQNIKNTIYGK